MIGRRRIAARDVTLSEVAATLGANEGELGFEQARALAYARRFARLSVEKAEELIAELTTNPRISRAKAVKIADLLPSDAATVRLIFAKEVYQPSEEEITRILEVVAKFAKE